MRGRLQQELAADGQTEARDPLRVDVRASLEEADRGPQVGLTVPAKRVEVAVAVALAAPVEQQHAVAVAHEEPGAGDRAARPAREDDHRRTVARRDVPGGEVEPVGCRERHALVRTPEVRRRHRAPDPVSCDDRDTEREHDEEPDGDHTECNERSPDVPAQRGLVAPAAPPQRDDADAEQPRAGQPGEHRSGVGSLDDPGDYREGADEGSDGGSCSGAQSRIDRGHHAHDRQRHQARDDVIAGTRTRLGMDERVVDDGHGDDGQSEPHEPLLAAAHGCFPYGG